MRTKYIDNCSVSVPRNNSGGRAEMAENNKEIVLTYHPEAKTWMKER